MIKKKYLLSSLGIMMIITSVFGYVDNNYGVVTYVSDSGSRIQQEASGAWSGIEDSSWVNKKYYVLNPSESNMNSYWTNYEFVFFAGHGDPDEIGGNQANGFSGWYMDDSDINSDLNSKVAILMSCESLQDFGEELVNNGVECVVGWTGTLSTSSDQEAFSWPYNFFTCSGWHDPDYCEDWASLVSGVSGSSAEGNCNDFTMKSMSMTTTQDINNSPNNKDVASGIKELKNGYVYSNPDKAYASKNTDKPLSKSQAIKLAKSFLNVSNEYKLTNIQEESYNYVIEFDRFIDKVRVTMDSNIAVINKNNGEIYMYRKTFTPNLEKEYSFETSRKEINKLFNSFKIMNVEQVLVENNDNIIKAWQVDYKDSSHVNSVIVDDATKKIV